jgi:hypothetical protein
MSYHDASTVFTQNDATVLYKAYKKLADKGDKGAAEKLELFAAKLLIDHPDNTMLKKDLKKHGVKIKELQDEYGLSFSEAVRQVQIVYLGFAATDQNTDIVEESIRKRNPAEQVCAHCAKKRPAKVCARCRQTSYCNAECQLAHWKKHKKVCKELVKKQQASSSK